jgi:hypothetical protein
MDPSTSAQTDLSKHNGTPDDQKQEGEKENDRPSKDSESSRPPSPPPKPLSPVIPTTTIPPYRRKYKSEDGTARVRDGDGDRTPVMSEVHYGGRPPSSIAHEDTPYFSREKPTRGYSVRLSEVPRRVYDELEEEREEGMKSRRQSDAPPTVRERLQPTVDHAKAEERRFAWKARRIGISLNVAIGLQVLVGSLVTGLGAVSTGRSLGIIIAVFGAIQTMLASYLAKNRGSNEPEASKSRAKALGIFLRDSETFLLDHGNELGSSQDDMIVKFRKELEDIQTGNGDGNVPAPSSSPG